MFVFCKGNALISHLGFRNPANMLCQEKNSALTNDLTVPFLSSLLSKKQKPWKIQQNKFIQSRDLCAKASVGRLKIIYPNNISQLPKTLQDVVFVM